MAIILFLSTLSLRRATGFHKINCQLMVISIHALLAESDVSLMLYDTSSLIFLSTLSLRRATTAKANKGKEREISIHALLAESDLYLGRQNPKHAEFLSTLSLRRATITIITICIALRFLSTLSLRRATGPPCVTLFNGKISIHALLAESDSQQPDGTTRTTYFYPRSPCGERRIIDIINNVINNFYPRSPCGERRLMI